MASKHGGARSGAGRPAGSKSRATKEARKTFGELAKDLSVEALETAAGIMRDDSMSPSARMAAVNTILDRAFGKPQQAVDHSSTDGTMSPIVGFTLEVMDEAALPSDEAATGLPN